MTDTCVIGWPISHSRSPLIHNYWRTYHDIPGTYEKYPVEPEALADFIKALPTSKYIGCNVTIPHKETVVRSVDSLDQIAINIGAANTVFIRQGKTHATSTDAIGFIENLKQNVPNFRFIGKTVTILGAGGSAKSLIAGLLAENVSTIKIYNRTAEKSAALTAQFGPKIQPILPGNITTELNHCDLLINTTSLGMVGQPPLTIDIDSLKSTAVVADIVYAPLVTDFLRRAERRGHTIVPGLGMLLHQAVGGFELWHGVKPKVTSALFALVEADLQNKTLK